MTWTKLDDSFWGNPKVIAAGNEAAGLYARALSYCGCHETDGLVPNEVTSFLGRPKAFEALVGVGLMRQNGRGFLIPDYLEFNPSKATLERKREKDRARKSERNP